MNRLNLDRERSREAAGTLTIALRGFQRHNMTDWGAALTFFAGISLLPALVILAGLVGVIGDTLTDELIANLEQRPAGPARSLALGAVEAVTDDRLGSGIALVLGLAGALWSASGYVGCFLRATEVISETGVHVPFWRLRPLGIAVTIGVIATIAAIALAIVLTGPLAEEAASAVGLERVVADVWDVAKWPAIVLVLLTIFAVLYWASPINRPHGFRWLTPGALVATAAWVIGSAAFAVYVSEFPAYNKLYGSLGAIVGFLAWLWLSNMALLFGAELNTELDRRRTAASPTA